MTDFVRPSVKAFLVCDMLIKDERTGKMSAIGMFTDIWANRFPCLHPHMAVYLCLTAGLGTYNFEIDLVHLDLEQIIGKGKLAPVEIPDPLKNVELGITIPRVVFPAAGKYEFRFSANGRMIDTKTFQVIRADGQGGH